MSFPQELTQYIASLSIQERSPAYFKTTVEGEILTCGGDLEKYGFSTVETGDRLADVLFFLEAFFPFEDPIEPIHGVKTEGGLNVDLHFLHTHDERWVLLLDSTSEEEKQLLLQQKGNDLSLLRQKYVKLVNQVLDQSQTLSNAETLFGLSGSGEWREVSLLLIRICELTDYSQLISPELTLKTLNSYLTVITQVIVEEGGLINHILGETAASFYGLVPSTTHSSIQAINTARRVASRLKDLSHVFNTNPSKNINIAAGITTGSVASGVIKGKSYRAFNAIGQNVLRSAQMIELMKPGVLLIDEDTYQCSQTYKTDFQLYAQDFERSITTFNLYSQALHD